MLAELADKAASVFMKLDHDQLCQRIASYVRARIAERCARMVDSSCR
jgi:hypothetical protein